jgi:nucleoside-diphosphate-sugar epimerase
MSSNKVSAGKLRVAMTGATGFVGSVTALVICERGHELTALVRDETRAKRLLPASVRTVAGDLQDSSALDALMSGVDVVVHVAGAISAASETGFMQVNADGTRAVMQAAQRAGVKRFVHVSSLAAREPAISPYCASKAKGEEIVTTATSDMEWIIVRPPAVYGPGDKATLPLIQQLSRRVAYLTGRRDQRVSVIHVDDLAQALVVAAEGAVKPGQIYEVDDGQPGGYDWDGLAAAAGVSLGFQPRIRLLPKPILVIAGAACAVVSAITGKAFILSSGKVRELYHSDWVIHGRRLDETGQWRAQKGFAAGFAETLAWYRKQGWLPDR